MTNISRHDFLKFARTVFLYLSGALAFGGLFRFLDYEPNPTPKTEFDLGPVSNYPLDSRTVLYDPPAVLLHTESGFSALSLICTHLGCTLEPTADGFACPCHGSLFAPDGKVVHGPATKGLPILRVEQNEQNHVILYKTN